MSDTTLNRFLASGTNAQRLAFTPAPASPASGPSPLCIWYETDTGDTYASSAGGAWHKVNTGSAAGSGIQFLLGMDGEPGEDAPLIIGPQGPAGAAGGGSTPTIVQSGFLTSSSSVGQITLGAAPTAGNLLIAMGGSWTSNLAAAGNWQRWFYQGAQTDDVGYIFVKQAGSGESTTQQWCASTSGWEIGLYEINSAALATIYNYTANMTMASNNSISLNIGVPKAGSIGLVMFMSQLGTNPTITPSGVGTTDNTSSDSATTNGGPRTAVYCHSTGLSTGAWTPSASYSSTAAGHGYAYAIIGGL